MHTDPIADMLTRIRNANKAMQETTEMPTSQLKEQIAQILKDEGYISGFSVVSADEFNAGQDKQKHRAYGTLVVELKFGRNRERIITDLKRISKPGRRVYARKDRLPRVLGGHGHGDPLHVGWARHEPHGGGARCRRRGRLLHLVSQ